MSAAKREGPATEPVLGEEGEGASLLDIVDHVLTKGVFVSGDLVLGVADIDLVYLRLNAVLCAADRVLGPRPRGARARNVAGGSDDLAPPPPRIGGSMAGRLGHVVRPASKSRRAR